MADVSILSASACPSHIDSCIGRLVTKPAICVPESYWRCAACRDHVKALFDKPVVVKAENKGQITLDKLGVTRTVTVKAPETAPATMYTEEVPDSAVEWDMD